MDNTRRLLSVWPRSACHAAGTRTAAASLRLLCTTHKRLDLPHNLRLLLQLHLLL